MEIQGVVIWIQKRGVLKSEDLFLVQGRVYMDVQFVVNYLFYLFLLSMNFCMCSVIHI